MKIAERLAAVETQVSGLQTVTAEIAKDVKEIRDFMLTSRGRWGGWKTVGALLAGAFTVGASAAAIARYLHG